MNAYNFISYNENIIIIFQLFHNIFKKIKLIITNKIFLVIDTKYKIVCYFIITMNR